MTTEWYLPEDKETISRYKFTDSHIIVYFYTRSDGNDSAQLTLTYNQVSQVLQQNLDQIYPPKSCSACEENTRYGITYKTNTLNQTDSQTIPLHTYCYNSYRSVIAHIKQKHPTKITTHSL